MRGRSELQQSRWLHYAIALLLLLICLRVWSGPVPIVEPAQAQIPDAGTQRVQMLEEARRTNQLLSEIKELLKTQTFNVRMQGADNQADAPGNERIGR